MADVFLNATSDINTYVNLARSKGDLINPSVFYTKQLLDTIRVDGQNYCYYQLADECPIQEKADKLVIRRWAPLQAHTVPLEEGIPPKSDKGSVERYELQAFQYGRYMEFSDKVDFAVVDPVIAHYTQEYSIVAIETLDMLARETLLGIAQRYYAGAGYTAENNNGVHGPDNDTITGALNHFKGKIVTSVEDLKVTSKPNMTDLRLIVLAMKRALVKPRINGKFLVIGSPEFYYDMISDPTVEKYMTYNQSTYSMYDNSRLVPMFEMEFQETLVCPTTSTFMKDGKECIRLYRLAADNTTYEYLTLQASTANAAPVGETPGTIKVTTVDGYVNDDRTGQPGSYIPGQKIWDIAGYNAACKGSGNDWQEFKVQHILVVGKDALLRTGLQGEGQTQVFVKQKGSTGVLDPIDQRQSIGFKINSVGFGSTRLEAVQDYICVPSQLNAI
jgi:N4-gp56 family major capsid protein